MILNIWNNKINGVDDVNAEDFNIAFEKVQEFLNNLSNSINISYTDNIGNLSATNVQDAIDALSKLKIPSITYDEMDNFEGDIAIVTKENEVATSGQDIKTIDTYILLQNIEYETINGQQDGLKIRSQMLIGKNSIQKRVYDLNTKWTKFENVNYTKEEVDNLIKEKSLTLGTTEDTAYPGNSGAINASNITGLRGDLNGFIAQANNIFATKDDLATKADKDDSVYELIEEIDVTQEGETAISRTQEPNGTPYSFKAVIVKGHAPATTVSNGQMNVYIEDSEGKIIGLATATAFSTTERYFRFEAFKRHGVMISQVNNASNKYGSPVNMLSGYDEYITTENNPIKRVRFLVTTADAALPIGSTFKIYGVR